MDTLQKTATLLALAFPLPAAAQELDLTPKILYEIRGDLPFHHFGIGVWPLRDVDGDGYEDLLVTDKKVRPDDRRAIGFRSARVFSGRDGRHLYRVAYDPPPEGSRLGSAATNYAQLGDLDDDGVADFIVGDPGVGIRVAVIFSGRTGSVIRVHQGPSVASGLGTYALGDLDLDGIIDYALQTGTSDTPRVHAIHSGASGEEIARLQNSSGHRVVGIDDLNEDAIPDLAVVEDGTNVVKFVSGALRGTFDSITLPDELILGHYIHEADDELVFAARETWHPVHRISDLDGDGVGEILVQLLPSGVGFRGVAMVAISPLKARRLWTAEVIDESLVGTYEQVGEIGDLDGDGVTEIVTPVQIISSFPHIQLVRVISGANGATLYSLAAESTTRDLTVVSDLDGDGIREVALGERFRGDDHTGRVIIYSFGPASQKPEPYRPGNPQLSVDAGPGEVTLAWPAAVTNPMPEWSTDLENWHPLFEGPAPESGRFTLPGTRDEPEKYFRLRYEVE